MIAHAVLQKWDEDGGWSLTCDCGWRHEGWGTPDEAAVNAALEGHAAAEGADGVASSDDTWLLRLPLTDDEAAVVTCAVDSYREALEEALARGLLGRRKADARIQVDVLRRIGNRLNIAVEQCRGRS